MVKLNDVQVANAALIKKQPLVAVFFGGTTGIGHYTLRALASAASKEGKGFRAYIVGRKVKTAEEVIAECCGIYPEGEFKFIQTDDLSLLANVDQACAEITKLENGMENPRIDYLMMSTGGSIFLPRTDTKEGLDKTMSLMYYSRMKTLKSLLPLLLQSSLPATIVSVYAAGMEKKLIAEDLSLRKPDNFSYAQARSHMVYMTTLFMESIAQQNPGKLRLIHVFPGLVLGPGFQNPDLPSWFKIVWNWIFVPLFARFVTIPPEVCGARMVSFASERYPAQEVAGTKDVAVGTDGKLGSGVYAVDEHGENNVNSKAYEKFDKDEMRVKVWEHTVKAFEVIEAGKVFVD